MRVLSLFDGIGCASAALENLGANVDEYVSYEIDRRTQLTVAANRYDAVLRGDVLQRDQKHREPGRFNLLTAGSPCQGFSRVGTQLGFEDPRSVLYFEFERVLEETQPEYWLLENVKMSKANEEVITERLGVEPIRICASEISSQRRPRLYWTNIPVAEFTPQGRSLAEIIDFDDATHQTDSWHAWFERKRELLIPKQYSKILTPDTDYAICQIARQYANWQGNYVDSATPGKYRYLSPEECEELHGLPRGYTDMLPRSARYKALGNGWAVQVVEQILKGIV